MSVTEDAGVVGGQDQSKQILELEAENARLRRIDVELGRVELAIIMADPDFDGDSLATNCADRLVSSVNRLAGKVQTLTRAGDELREAAILARAALAGDHDAAAAIDALDAALGHEASADDPDQVSQITMVNRNWRGHVGLRRISTAGLRVWHGSTSWHPTPAPLLRAFDLDKRAWRDFALEDCAFLFASRKHSNGIADAPVMNAAGGDALCETARNLRVAIQAIATAEPRFEYVAAQKCGLDTAVPGSPFDRGKAAAYGELQAVALGALKYC